MSKASEWADRRRQAERDQPTFVNAQMGMVARVNTLGHLEFTGPCVEAKDVPTFIDWLLDTFSYGDPSRKTHSQEKT